MSNFSSIYIVLFLFKTSIIMEFKDFEFLLGKHVSTTTNIIGNEFENKLFENSFYYIKSEDLEKKLYEMQFKAITVLSNEDEIIKSVTIHFSKIVTKDFYNQLINEYGFPNEIKVIKKRKKISSEILNDEIFSQNMTKSNIELIDGTFEDEPLFIIWKDKDLKITIFFKRKQSVCDITFENFNPN